MAKQAWCDIGIVGAGIIGLTSALTLARAGYKVSIVAKNWAGDLSTEWASPWAGAAMLPYETDDIEDIKMQLASFRQFWALARNYPECGVQKVKAIEYWEGAKENRSNPWYGPYMPEFRKLSAAELPPNTTGGNTFWTTTINPDLYLHWLQKHLEQLYDVTFLQADVKSLDNARARLGCKLLLNASGHGAKSLASDDDAITVRGQTMVIKSSAPKVSMDKTCVIKRGTEYTYAIPRMGTGALIIGGVEDAENQTTTVDPAMRKDILRRVNALTKGDFDTVDLDRHVLKDIVAFRPARKGGYRIQRDGETIHAYGLAGAGYRYCFGVALKVAKLVDDTKFTPQPKL